MNYIQKKIREKTSYKNPKDRTNATLIALLLIPLVYVIFPSSQKDSFSMGVASGVFTMGLTLVVIQFWILDYFVEVREFKSLSSSLNRSCKLVGPHTKSIGIHLSKVFDSTKSLDDRWKLRHAFDASQRPEDLDLVISDAECDKAMRNIVELTNQRIGDGSQRFYLGLVTEIKRLQPVILAASFNLNPDYYYSGSAVGTKNAAYFGKAVGSTFTSLMRSHSDLDEIFYELENLEQLLMNDEMIDSHDEVRVLLRVKVKQLYHAVIIYKHSLNHQERLNRDILNGEFLTAVRKGQQYLV